MLFVICHPCISVSETIFAQSVSIARFGGILCFIESRSCKVFIVKYLINLRGGFRFSWCFALLWRGSLRAPAIPRAVPAGALYSWQVQTCRIGLWERGQRKKHSGPPGLDVRPAFSPRKTSLATETPTRELLREIPYLRVEGTSVRRSMKSSGEKKLEVSGSRRTASPFSFQRHHHRNMEREDYVPKRESRTNSTRDAEVQHSSARNQRRLPCIKDLIRSG